MAKHLEWGFNDFQHILLLNRFKIILKTIPERKKQSLTNQKPEFHSLVPTIHHWPLSPASFLPHHQHPSHSATAWVEQENFNSIVKMPKLLYTLYFSQSSIYRCLMQALILYGLLAYGILTICIYIYIVQ